MKANDLQKVSGERIVYVRKLRHSEIPKGAPVTELYAIHDDEGRQIGVAPDRELAFKAARQHELRPVSVH